MHPLDLRRLAHETGRYWSFRRAPTTVALAGNRFAKSLSPFTSHDTEDSFRELLREYSDYGVTRPAGYADVFHEIFRSPSVSYSLNLSLGACLAGGWQQALATGRHYDTYYQYDIRSAYLWAATLGMPDTRTYVRSRRPWKCEQGLFRVKLLEPTPTAPFPFQQARECIATVAEIETYGLRIGEVVDGVSWSHTISGDGIIAAIRKVSTWKQAARAYWGRWGQTSKITCVANGKSWQLPNRSMNIPWAHTIIERVKMRLWEHSKDAVHVFVDSVITPRRLPTGDNLGDWRLEKTYDDGIFVRGTGQYGSANSDMLDRMAGVPIGSDRRYTPAARSVVAPF